MLARNLLIAAMVIATLGATLYWVVSRGSSERPNAAARASHVEVDAGSRPLAPRVPPQAIAAASQPLMPDGYAALSLGMPLEALRRARPQMRPSPAVTAPDGSLVWEEDDASGARVIYLIDPVRRALREVQFASLLHTTDELRGHFEAMEARYGRPTGIWDCPATADTAPIRRLTWRRDIASVMEAVLIHQGAVSLTLLVATNDGIAAALGRSHCRPVRTPEEFANFPIAHTIPGEPMPFLRTVPRDS